MNWDIERVRRIVRTVGNDLRGDDIKYVDLFMAAHTDDEVEELIGGE